jgi:hypothetical protein
MKLLEAIIRVLWGETIEFLVTHLPANTHGPRVALPGKELKAKERSECRREAWQPIVEQLAGHNLAKVHIHYAEKPSSNNIEPFADWLF